MILDIVMALLGLASLLGLVVVVRQYQWTKQLNELEDQIEALEAQSDLQGPNYFICCELTSLIRKRNEIRRKMLF